MPSDLTQLIGGLDLEVGLLNGTTEKVRVRALPIRLLPSYFAVMDDEPAMVELFCERPAGWSDTLAPESFEKILVEGEALNADFFGRWLRRRMERQERLLPGLLEKALAAVPPTKLAPPSPHGSAKLPSAPATPSPH